MIELKFSGSNLTVTLPDGRVVTSDGIETKELKEGHSSAYKWLTANDVILAAWITAGRDFDFPHTQMFSESLKDSGGFVAHVSPDSFGTSLALINYMRGKTHNGASHTDGLCRNIMRHFKLDIDHSSLFVADVSSHT